MSPPGLFAVVVHFEAPGSYQHSSLFELRADQYTAEEAAQWAVDQFRGENRPLQVRVYGAPPVAVFAVREAAPVSRWWLERQGL